MPIVDRDEPAEEQNHIQVVSPSSTTAGPSSEPAAAPPLGSGIVPWKLVTSPAPPRSTSPTYTTG